MAKSVRIEGIAGGSGGVGGKTKGLSPAQIKKIQKAKPLTNPKSAVKIVKGNTSGPSRNFNEMLRKGANKDADTTALRRKNGELARTRASQVDVGKPAGRIKINTNPSKTTVFGPLKKQLDIRSGAASARQQANAAALKGLKPLKNKKK